MPAIGARTWGRSYKVVGPKVYWRSRILIGCGEVQPSKVCHVIKRRAFTGHPKEALGRKQWCAIVVMIVKLGPHDFISAPHHIILFSFFLVFIIYYNSFTQRQVCFQPKNEYSNLFFIHLISFMIMNLYINILPKIVLLLLLFRLLVGNMEFFFIDLSFWLTWKVCDFFIYFRALTK